MQGAGSDTIAAVHKIESVIQLELNALHAYANPGYVTVSGGGATFPFAPQTAPGAAQQIATESVLSGLATGLQDLLGAGAISGHMHTLSGSIQANFHTVSGTQSGTAAIHGHASLPNITETIWLGQAKHQADLLNVGFLGNGTATISGSATIDGGANSTAGSVHGFQPSGYSTLFGGSDLSVLKRLLRDNGFSTIAGSLSPTLPSSDTVSTSNQDTSSSGLGAQILQHPFEFLDTTFTSVDEVLNRTKAISPTTTASNTPSTSLTETTGTWKELGSITLSDNTRITFTGLH